MNELKELVKLFKSATFFVKERKIIAFNELCRKLCPEIEHINDFKRLFAFDYDLITDMTQSIQIVRNNEKDFYFNFIKFEKEKADYLVTIEETGHRGKSKNIDLFKDVFRLGYLFIDLDTNNNIKNSYLPSLFMKNLGVKNEISFFKNFISKEEIKKFQKEIYSLCENKNSYFNFNTKIKLKKDEDLFIQLRCFINPFNNRQLLCSTIEYSDLNRLQTNLAKTELTLLELYENIIDPILIIDTEKLISFNKAAKRVFDIYDINLSLDLLSKKYKDFIFDKKNFKKRIEDSFLLENGEKVYFEYTIIPIKVKNKNFYTIIFKDITETKELIQMLKYSKRRYDEILNSVFDGIVLTNNYIIEFWNKSAEKITGYSSSEVMGKAIHSIFREYDKEKNSEQLKYKGKIPKEFSLTKKIITKQGRKIVITITTTTFIDSKGEQKSVGIFQDITEKYLADEEIRKQKDELKAVNTALKNFFSILAHDMRTPVIQMLGLTELLLENYDDFPEEEQKKYLSMLQLSSKNGLELLDTLVEWGRTMTDKIIIEPQSFNISQIIEKVIRLNLSQSSSKSISFIYTPMECYVYADTKMVFTILNNLISNAIKFSYKNSEIIIKTESFEDKIRISVQDFGKGIKQSENIFLYDKKNIELGTENEKGKGIGLMFTAELIKKNNGEIWFESQLDKGSTFYISLPKGKKDSAK